MPNIKILTAIALKLHAFGLNRLNDPNWTGAELYYNIRDHLKGFKEPTDLLRAVHKRGLLFNLGMWFFVEYFLEEDYYKSLGTEYRFWYLEDLLMLLDSADVNPNDPLIIQARELYSKIDSIELFSQEEEYWRALRSRRIPNTIEKLIQKFNQEITSLTEAYATEYAHRVFHDRQLCEFISKLLVAIGFDGTPDADGPPQKWIDRPNSWPTWALGAIISRDRGFCAQCSVSITSELLAPKNIDHIIPLAKAGTNDLLNLQLLCGECNNKKRATIQEVRSSIPNYLQSGKRKRQET